jgi:hypothetical protein
MPKDPGNSRKTIERRLGIDIPKGYSGPTDFLLTKQSELPQDIFFVSSTSKRIGVRTFAQNGFQTICRLLIQLPEWQDEIYKPGPNHGKVYYSQKLLMYALELYKNKIKYAHI